MALSSSSAAAIFPLSSPDFPSRRSLLPLNLRREHYWVRCRLRVVKRCNLTAATRVRCQRFDHVEREPGFSTYEESRNRELQELGRPFQPSSADLEDEVRHSSSTARTQFELDVRQVSQEGSDGSKNKDLVEHYNLQERDKRVGLLEETLKQDTAEVGHKSELSERWRDYHGANDWRGLLDPLNEGLRGEILKYGEFTQATYDAFDFDTHSKYCGTCLFGRRKFFERVGLSHRGYSVTKYLYATSHVHLPNWFRRSESLHGWNHDSNWIGFVAVTTDEKEIANMGRRDILISWRGTIMFSEWLDDMDEVLTPVHFEERKGVPNAVLENGHNIEVERGFWGLYNSRNQSSKYSKQSASEQVITEVKKLLEQYKGEELSITITGHSLGGALAHLSAFEIAARGLNQCNASPTELKSALPTNNNARDVEVKDDLTTVPICLFTFGCPRVGNQSFKTKIEQLGIKSLRVVNVNDTVPKVPGIVFNDNLGKLVRRLLSFLPNQMSWAWSHVGMELLVNNTHSPYLKPNGDPLDWHNLEAYLHLVDGHRGGAGAFVSSTNRDLALVNKSSDFLRDEYLVPPNWMQMENKGMVKNAEGKWVERGREDDDVPFHQDHS